VRGDGVSGTVFSTVSVTLRGFVYCFLPKKTVAIPANAIIAEGMATNGCFSNILVKINPAQIKIVIRPQFWPFELNLNVSRITVF